LTAHEAAIRLPARNAVAKINQQIAAGRKGVPKDRAQLGSLYHRAWKSVPEVNHTCESGIFGFFRARTHFVAEILLMSASEIRLLPERLEKEIKALDWRDLQLWGIGACVLIAVAAGFFLLLAPHLLWRFTTSTQSSNLPQYTAGLIVLLLLLNAQTLHQRLRLQKSRSELVRQLQLAERAAQVDALTGVFNRRNMEEMLIKEASRAERYHCSLCLAVIDVDRFKDFNTRFGHLEGDRVLTVVASLLRKNFRAADTIVRYGGDEFVVIMPETDLQQASLAIDRLQQLYFAGWNQANSQRYSITVTCGIAEFTPGMSASDLIHRADCLMLGAKLRTSASA
jgi:diguanylate cyclase (GGDEF)-like protein